MKNIAVISNVGWTVYNFRNGIIKFLISKGYQVTVFTKFDDYISRIEDLGCTCVPLNNMDFKGMNPLNDLKLAWEFKTLFKKYKIDLALLYTPKVNIFGTLASKMSDTIAIPTINGLGTVFNPNQNKIVQKIIIGLYQFALKFAPVVFFQNHDDYDFFKEKGIIRKQIPKFVKGSGVDTEAFNQMTYSNRTNDLIFAFAARLLKEKGIFEFIEAAEIVKEKYSNAQFVIIGSSSFFPGNIDEEKITEAEKKGLIKFWGGTDNMSFTLQDVDVLVLPSYYREGVPRILIEGLSKGLPLITTHNVGCKETVDEGKNGFLVEIKNAKQLANVMIQMLEMPLEKRVQMGQASRQKALNECSEAVVFKEYELVLQSLK